MPSLPSRPLPSSGAVIFDMDGVLVDGEPLHFAAARDVLAGFGAELTWEVYTDWIGETFDAIWPDMQRRFALPVAAATTSAPSGRACRRSTSGTPSRCRARATCSPACTPPACPWAWPPRPSGPASTPRWRASTSPASCPSPSPATRSRAASRTPRSTWPPPPAWAWLPSRCLVLEDSPAGVASARAAGMRVIGVCINGGSGRPLEGAERIIEALSDFDLGWVGAAQREGARSGA